MLTGIIPAMLVVIVARVAVTRMRDRYRRHRAFRPSPAWRKARGPARHRATPEPRRDWVIW